MNSRTLVLITLIACVTQRTILSYPLVMAVHRPIIEGGRLYGNGCVSFRCCPACVRLVLVTCNWYNLFVQVEMRLEERRIAHDRHQEMLLRRQLEAEHNRREQEVMRRIQEEREREAR